MKKLTVCWISAGVSSFVAGWLARNHIDQYIYLDIRDQHPDSLRFIRDCEAALGKPIEILRSRQYKSVSDVCRGVRFVRRMTYAPCTDYLKKRVRKEWEYAHSDCDIAYVWGMDLNEKARAERIEAAMPDFRHEFPLIERGLTKQDAHGILKRLGINRPAMYDLGYQNNNCVGCLKGGAATGTKSEWTSRRCSQTAQRWSAKLARPLSGIAFWTNCRRIPGECNRKSWKNAGYSASWL